MGRVVSLSETSNKRVVRWEMLEELRRKLFVGGNCYVFVDPIRGVPWDRTAAKEVDGYSEFIVNLSRLRIPPEISPFFVQVRNSVGDFFDYSFERACEQEIAGLASNSVCGWFCSELSPRQLCAQFATQICRVDEGSKWLFRFYDPRVARHIGPFVSDRFYLGAVKRWLFIDEEGCLDELSCATDIDRYVLDQESVVRLDWLAVINSAGAMLRSFGRGGAGYHELYAAALVARSFGLSPLQEADCVAFMLHRCSVHGRIETHPLVKSWLNDARAGVCYYVDAAARADSFVWAEIALGNWQSTLIEQQGADHG